jgi:hypothetical protein
MVTVYRERPEPPFTTAIRWVELDQIEVGDRGVGADDEVGQCRRLGPLVPAVVEEDLARQERCCPGGASPRRA